MHIGQTQNVFPKVTYKYKYKYKWMRLKKYTNILITKKQKYICINLYNGMKS